MNQKKALYAKQVWVDGDLTEKTILIDGSQIVGVMDGRWDFAAYPVEEINKGIVMPGFLDVHVHINEPGRTKWEGFDSATKAAAAGGLTTLVEMPLNASPVTTSIENFNTKLQSTEGKLHVNCGFWGGIVPKNAGKLEDFLQSGILGIKAFLTHSGIDEFPNVTKKDLAKAMPILAKYNMPMLAHCELSEDHKGAELLKKRPKSYKAWLQSRPKSWENKAIEMMINLCRKYNCPTHIVHLASAEALNMLNQAKAERLKISVETCPHYVYFDAENIPNGDTRFKCAPPIREKENNHLLRQAIENGQIDLMASDHSPAPPSTKALKSGNLLKAWGGISSLQYLLPLTWTILKKQGLGLEKVVHLLSENPARLARLDDRKGKIAVGYDADLTVWNPDQSFVVKEEDILHRHKITPYLGERLFGKVFKTFVNGQLVFDGGSFVNLDKGKVEKRIV